MVSFGAGTHLWEILCDIKVQREENIIWLLLGDWGKAACDSRDRYVHAVLLQTAPLPHKLSENKKA